MKAKNIIQCAKRLVEEYGGIVPEKMEDLLTLAGVGRKTAKCPGKYLPMCQVIVVVPM